MPRHVIAAIIIVAIIKIKRKVAFPFVSYLNGFGEEFL